ncbi:MAG: FAD-dependent oxidoreductase [Nitrososphaeria archaeon]
MLKYEKFIYHYKLRHKATMNFTLKQAQKLTNVNSGKKVAIIGSGPAGLTAANELVCLGHEVHVYEQMPEAGGLLIFGIPEERIKKEQVRECVNKLKEMGAVFYPNIKIGYDIKLSELLKRYDAVLIATGAWKNRRLGIRGEDLEGVHHALDYIIYHNSVKLGYSGMHDLPPLHGCVAVIGGGLTAVDACQTVLELGVKRVFLIYRRTKTQAPAGRYQIEKLEAKGVEFVELAQPVEFIGNENNRVKAIKLIKTRLQNVSNRRPEPVPIKGSEYVIDVDHVLLAIGLCSTLPVGEENLEITKNHECGEDSCRTNIDKVFVAGDVRHGASFIGPAIASGMKAAKEIHEYLSKTKC